MREPTYPLLTIRLVCAVVLPNWVVTCVAEVPERARAATGWDLEAPA